jgi:hypothetical protein
VFDYLNLDPTPVDEPVVQIMDADPEVLAQAVAQCERFVDLLRRINGDPPGSAYFKIDLLPYDNFPDGILHYPQLRIYFEDTDPEQSQYAHWCESNPPSRWNDGDE